MAPEIGAHIRRESISNALINFAINGGLAWWLMNGHGPLAWWGQHGFAQDMLITAVLLTFIVSLIMIALHRKKVRDGKLPALSLDSGSALQSLVARLPESMLLSAILFVVVALLLFVPVVFIALQLLGIETMSVTHYAIFKGVWAGVLAALMVIPMIMLGLRAPPE